jgi:hypothetical protein
MSAIDNTPTNKNFLSPLNFKFIMKRAPHVNFFVQKVNIPAISLAEVNTPNPLLRIPEPGDHLDFDELRVSFRVDEDLQNYLEIQNWLRSIGKQSFQQYGAIASKKIYSGESIKSEISLTVLSSAKRPNYEIVFQDAFPTGLSSIEFDTSLEDVLYLEADASFRYTKYEITRISS